MAVFLRDHNPPVDALSDAGPAFQRAVDAAARDLNPEIHLEPRSYLVSSTVDYPETPASEVRRFVIRGNGARITLDGPAGTTFINRTPANLVDAGRDLWVPEIADLTLGSNGANIHHGIRWWIASSPVFRNVAISDLNYGIEVLNGVGARFQNCSSTNCLGHYRAIGGEDSSGPTIGGGTNANANSDVTTFSQCNASGGGVAASGLLLSLVGQFRIEQCSITGSDIGVGVIIEGESNSGYVTKRKGVIDGLWLDVDTSLSTGVFINAQESIFDIQRLTVGSNLSSSLQNVLIDARGSRECIFNVSDIEFQDIDTFATGSHFADDASIANANQWNFRSNLLDASAASHNKSLGNPARWLGNRPRHLHERSYGYS